MGTEGDTKISEGEGSFNETHVLKNNIFYLLSNSAKINKRLFSVNNQPKDVPKWYELLVQAIDRLPISPREQDDVVCKGKMTNTLSTTLWMKSKPRAHRSQLKHPGKVFHTNDKEIRWQRITLTHPFFLWKKPYMLPLTEIEKEVVTTHCIIRCTSLSGKPKDSKNCCRKGHWTVEGFLQINFHQASRRHTLTLI